MSFTTWLRDLQSVSRRLVGKRSGTRVNRARRPASRKLLLEVLEDRALPSANLGWAFALDTPRPNASWGRAVATDTAGNVYEAGEICGTVDFGSIFLTSTGDPTTGARDGFVSKVDPSGNFLWAVSMGGLKWDGCQGIAVDSLGNVYVTGYFNGSQGTAGGTATFGSTTLTSPQGSDAFVAKLDASTGAVLWAKNGLGVAGVANVYGYGIAADGQGNAFGATISSGGSVASEAAVCKLDANGNLQWNDILVPSSGALSRATSIAVAAGSVYVTGYWNGTVDFDPGPGTHTLFQSDNTAFTLKLSSAGAYQWVSAYEPATSGASSSGGEVAVDGAGNVYSTGRFSGSVDFDPATNRGKKGQLILDSSNGNAFITKLTATGSLIWAKGFGGSSAYANGLALDAAGAVYVTGTFQATGDFNPGAGVNLLTNAGGPDIFVEKLDTNGNFQWAVSAGGTNNDQGLGIAVDGSGNVFVTGFIYNATPYSVDFDPGPGSYYLSTSWTSMYLWKLTQA